VIPQGWVKLQVEGVAGHVAHVGVLKDCRAVESWQPNAAEHLIYAADDRKASAALAEAKARIPALKAGIDDLGVSGTKSSKFVADV
jgi:hypothetical protein